MTARRALYILIALLLTSAAFAGLSGAERASLSRSIDLMLNALVLAFTYIWYYQDATERKFKRSISLGAAIVLFSAASVPYYLFKSRPRGERGRSLLKYAAVCMAFLVVLVISASMAHAQR